MDALEARGGGSCLEAVADEAAGAACGVSLAPQGREPLEKRRELLEKRSGGSCCGGSCSGDAVPGGDSRGGSCGSGGAAVPGGGSRGGSCGSGQAGPLQGEAAAAGEEAFAQTLSILHQRAFALLADGGADLVLGHMCVSSAIGFASSGWSGALSRSHLNARAMAYGCLCLAAKMHWQKDTAANGLACLAHLRDSWGEALEIPIGDRQAVRQRCEGACLSAGFSP